ncbi:hypothetical protein GCM10017786_07900 [Amycolatopsis deserti]|uniref:Uncharacterized protein n=1 Tax=Amycolatopsis deserti TaxID=185696 RepID=A0ABQ3IEN5_9PSEU|nr:hypothetical protein [Amycolatopsis deserti]GHE80249.1 hypothetical protein GCM10017786_07900 [Amycolatopsis deserti]
MVYAEYDPIAVVHSDDLLEEHGDTRRHAAIDLQAVADQCWAGVVDQARTRAVKLPAETSAE